MLSRVADSIFWMARYMERTDGMLRVLRTNYIASQDEVKDYNWQVLLRHYSDASPEKLVLIGGNSIQVLEHLLIDKENTASVYSSITRGRENARAVQDHITKEVWQCQNDYYHLIRDKSLHRQIKQGDPVTAFDQLLHHGLLYHGTVDITMSRGEGFTFLNLGKFLERALLSVNVMDIKLTELRYDLQHPVEVPALRYLLYSLSGYEHYLKVHRGNFNAEDVLKQILHNEHFPHSVCYCLNQVTRYFKRLETESLPDVYKEMDFRIGRVSNHVRFQTLDLKDPEGLRIIIHGTRELLLEIAAGLNKYYFGHT